MFKETVVASVVVVTAMAAWGAGTPAQKCQAGKNAAAGKYSACRQKAEGKLVTSGDTAKYDAALAKCTSKFSDKWAGLEASAEGACPTNGEATAFEYNIRAHADVVAWGVSGAARFTDNADGSITDNQTGLSWEKKVKLGGGTDFANLHDADNYYLWAGSCSISGDFCQPDAASQAACAAGVEGNALGCAACGMGAGTCDTFGETTVWQWLGALNTAAFSGHSDWRIAKRSELESIIDIADGTPPAINVAFHGASCGVACTDITSAACSCTQSNGYWAATSSAPYPDYAWIVFFTDGFVYATGKDNNNYVRAVRGGS